MDVILAVAALLLLPVVMTVVHRLRHQRPKLRDRADGEPLGRRIDEQTERILRRQR